MNIHRVTLELTEDSYNLLRSVVDSGEYASESDAIADLIPDLRPDRDGFPDTESFKQWMLEDVLAADNEYDLHPETAFTPEQLRNRLSAARQGNESS